ncbi:MAG: pentapeptide repeat-containing protein [Cyanobacteria bacterium SZAS LIN-2]|nr:pentapeptide repeat-containing protein [Cyanobacteria bacterium SZAS LIN-2]
MKGVTFKNSDLSQSRMCWNDFINCDFTEADLSGCDMRASNFENCNFTGANLTEADLRRSHITNCNFTGAILTEALALPAAHREHRNGGSIEPLLTAEQSATVGWIDLAGEEPPGG